MFRVDRALDLSRVKIEVSSGLGNRFVFRFGNELKRPMNIQLQAAELIKRKKARVKVGGRGSQGAGRGHHNGVPDR